MNQNDLKQHSDSKSEHRSQGTPSHPQRGSSHDEKGEATKDRQTERSPAAHGKSQGVTTNPEDVGAGGGSSPAGHGNQDSRTWGAHDNQQNVSHDKHTGSLLDENTKQQRFGHLSKPGQEVAKAHENERDAMDANETAGVKTQQSGPHDKHSAPSHQHGADTKKERVGHKP